MNNNRHLLQEERNIIEQRLMEKESFKSIGRELGKDPTTIAKEVRSHIQFRKTGCYGKPFNNCLNRKDCTTRYLCGNQKCNRLDSLISPLLMKGQSLHHICANHADEIMLNERSLYNYVDDGIFTARNIDMPRVVRMGKRRKKKDSFKVDKKCRIGRTYQDFLQFMAEQPGLSIVEMDTVEGRKGGKVLQTLHFTIPQLMLAFIRDRKPSPYLNFMTVRRKRSG